jgi:phage replication-related protein YjqB (UPF0714/DUF867 family)
MKLAFSALLVLAFHAAAIEHGCRDVACEDACGPVMREQ